MASVGAELTVSMPTVFDLPHRMTSPTTMTNHYHRGGPHEQSKPKNRNNVERVLIAKSMLAYSDKMRQIAQNRNLIPFMGGRGYELATKSKDPQKRMQPKRAKHSASLRNLQDATQSGGDRLDGFQRIKPSSGQMKRTENPSYNFPTRPASDPITMMESSNQALSGFRRYGIDSNLVRNARLNGETNVLTFLCDIVD